MEFLLVSIVAGLIGTWGMTMVLYIITRSGLANADMVRALGSSLTRSLETSLFPGLIIHFAAGIPFAMLYVGAFGILGLSNLSQLVLAGGIIGLAHGFAFSFILVILAEYHPVELFQQAGFSVAVSHFIAHIIYGLLIGLVTGLIGYY